MLGAATARALGTTALGLEILLTPTNAGINYGNVDCTYGADPPPSMSKSGKNHIRQSKFANKSNDELRDLLETATGKEKQEILNELWARGAKDTDRKSRFNHNRKKPKGTNKKPKKKGPPKPGDEDFIGPLPPWFRK